MERVMVDTKPWNHDKSPKRDNYVVMLYFLLDVSSDPKGYSHYIRFGEEKWIKE
jgi:hypothetical protein